MASPIYSKRAGHGMGVFTINGKDRLAVFGGFDGRTTAGDESLLTSA